MASEVSVPGQLALRQDDPDGRALWRKATHFMAVRKQGIEGHV